MATACPLDELADVFDVSKQATGELCRQRMERGRDGRTYNKLGASNAAAIHDSNTVKAKSPGLSADDPL